MNKQSVEKKKVLEAVSSWFTGELLYLILFWRVEGCQYGLRTHQGTIKVCTADVDLGIDEVQSVSSTSQL